MTAGAAKSTMLLCALQLAVSMQPGGIGLFLAKSHRMAQDAYVLAQRIFGESDVLLLSVEPKANGSRVNHAYENFKQKAKDPQYVQNKRLSAVDHCIHVVWKRYEAAQKKQEPSWHRAATTCRTLLPILVALMGQRHMYVDACIYRFSAKRPQEAAKNV